MTISESDKQRLFHAAAELSNPEQRRAFLDAACGANERLRAELESLLAHDATAGDFLERPAPDATQAPANSSGSLATEAPRSVSEQAGVLLAGRYKLLEEIGEGGMGTVWVAEQSAPVRRKVAIKLVKAGMDSRQVLARFEAERQALAVMDHPNIAKVFDGGVTEQGRPFFVMEYVKGVPLTQYCDQARLGVSQRLELFVAVCQAVQHAHQKGIIHRDLKPSNILVCLYDGRPVPKVIDFGLAKAVHQSLTEQTLHTAHGMMVGTPLYMSPEQAEFNNLDIDTRSDIYSLGVILYELLTGSTPLERKQLQQAAFNEVLRLIKEVEPPKPSTRLSGSASLPSVAAQRGVEPRLLQRSLIGDLDWIVMKALDKERSRRYETANGLALDIGRFLRDEPVSAGPPSATYRLRKLVRRNKAQALAAALVALALVGGVIGTSIGLVRARQAEALASSRLEEVEAANVAAERALDATRAAQRATDAALRESEEARQEAEAVSSYLVDIFERPDPNRDGRSVKVADVLDRAARQVPMNFAASPAIQIKLYDALGDAFRSLGLPAQSLAIRQKQTNLIEATYGRSHSKWGAALLELGDSLQFAGKLEEAIQTTSDAVAALSAAFGEAHPDTLAAQVQLAKVHSMLNRDEEALRLLESIRAPVAAHAASDQGATSFAGVDPLDSFFAKEYGAALLKSGRTREAIEVLENAVATVERRKRAPSQFEIILGNDLAVAYGRAGRNDKALLALERQLKLQRETLSPDHPHMLIAASNWALMARENGEPPSVYEATLRDVRERRERVLGLEHPDTLQARVNEILPHFARGEHQLAAERLEPLLREIQATTGPASAVTLQARQLLGDAYQMLGQAKRSVEFYREVLRVSESEPEAAGWNRNLTLEQLALAHLEAGDIPQAIDVRREAAEYCARRYGARELTTLNAEVALALLLITKGDGVEEGLSLARRAADEARATFGPKHDFTYQLLNRLGECQRLAKRFDDAMTTQREALRLAQELYGPAHRTTLSARNNLALSYWEAGQRDEATTQLEQLLADVPPGPVALTANVLGVRENLAAFYKELNRPREAAVELRKVVDADQTLERDGTPEAIRRRLSLARYLGLANDLPQAIDEFRRCLDRIGERTDLAPERLGASRALGELLAKADRNTEAFEHLRTVLASPVAQSAPPDSTAVLGMRRLFARLAYERADFPTAERLYRQVLESLAPDAAVDRLTTELTLGMSEFMVGKRDAGLERVRRIAGQVDELMPPRRELRYQAHAALASLLRRTDNPADALPVLEPLARETPSDVVEERKEQCRTLDVLAHVYQDLKRYDDALRTLRDLQTRWSELVGENSIQYLECLERQAQTLAALQQIAEARRQFQDTLQRASETLSNDHALTIRVTKSWADFLFEQREFAASEQVLLGLVKQLESQGAEALVPLADARLKLALVYRETNNPRERRRLLDQILASADELRKTSPQTVIGAQRETGHSLWQQKRYAEALKQYVSVEKDFQELFGPHHLEVFHARFNQAAQYYGLRQFERAESTLTSLLDDLPRIKELAEQDSQRRLCRELLGSIYRDSNQWTKYERALRGWIADTQPNSPVETQRVTRFWRAELAISLANQGRLNEAVELLSKLTDELTAAGADKGPEAALLRHCLMNLGAAYSNAGQHAQAARTTQRLLDLVIKQVGPASPHTVRVQIELATHLRSAKQWSESERHFREALQAMQKLTGDPEHPDTARVRNELGLLFIDRGDAQAAETTLRETLAIRQRLKMPDDPLLLSIENNLGVLLWRQGKFRDALPIYQRIVAQIAESRGADHPEADIPRMNVAAQLLGLGEYAQAETTLRELIAVAEKRMPPQTRDLRQFRLLLATALRKQLRWQLAIELTQPQLRDAAPMNDDDLEFLVKGWNIIAICQLHLERYDEARQAAERALEFQAGATDKFLLLRTRALQAVALAGLNRIDEAEPLLTESFDGQLAERDAKPRAHFEMLPELARLVERIYERQNQPEKQAAWRTKAEQWERDFAPPKPQEK